MSRNMPFCCGVQKLGRLVLRGLIAGAVGISGHAAILSWSGVGTNSFWSDALNWSPAGTPTNGDTIVFPSSKPQLTNTNDLPDSLTYNQVCFTGAGGGYNIFGNVFTVTNSIQATNSAGTNTINNNVNFSTADIDITVSNALILAGALSTTTGVGFSKNGAGTLTLSGSVPNGYSGPTHVNDGLLELKKLADNQAIGPGTLTIGNSTGAAGSVVVRDFGNLEIEAASVVVNGDGVLDLNGNIEVFGPQVTLNDGGRIGDISPGVLDLRNGTTVAALSTNQTLYSAITADVNVGSSTCTFTQTVSGVLLMYGHISGSASITQSGAGQLYFYASNSFTGPVTINGGMLAVLDSWSLGTTNNGTTVNEPGTLNIANPLNVVGEPLTLNSSNGYAGNGAVWVNSGGSNSWSGPVTLENNALIQESGLGLSLNFTGPISGSFGVTMFGGGTLVYSGTNANTYTGPTVVNNGVLLLEKAVANGAVPGNVIVNSGGTLRLGTNEQIADTAGVTINSGGLFDFNGNYESIDTLTGVGNVTFGTSGYLLIGVNGGTSTFNGVMSGTGFPGGYTVGKFGTGTFTMTGNNTYQNGSNVRGGTLIIDGNQPQSPILFMNSGTTLGGSGVVGDILAGANIAPGLPGSPAVLTCSNVAFSSSGVFTVELKGPNPGTDYTQLNVRGTVNLTNAGLLLNPAFTKPVSVGQQFVIITNEGPGPVLGQFNSAPDHAALCKGGYCFTIDYAGGSGGNDVVLTVLTIPPRTVTLNCVNQGWYDSTGFHNPAVSNYLCGEDAIGSTNLYRNYFVFNAPMDADSIVHAELLVNCYSNSSPHGQETYLVRSVSTPIVTLEGGGSGLTNIYNDLGDGAVYGVRNVSTNESRQKAIIPLNVKFINDISAAAASLRSIALGGSIVSLDPTNSNNQYLFADSGASSNDVQLRLTYGTSTTLNAANTGWYDITGFHSAGNSNYVVGATNGTFYRDFFVYDLPLISGPLVNAQLLVNSYTNSSPSGRNTYELYDVTTPLTALTNNASGATNTYADLGSGTLYGGRDVYVSESGLPVGIPLDTAFVSVSHARSGGTIALGGVISSLTPSSTNESLYGFSLGNPTDVQLWLGSLINPAATPFFVNGATTNLGKGMIQFVLSGTSGTSNEIQGSFDFQNWDYIGDLVMTNTTSAFTYTNNSTVPYRFFRAELMP